MNNTTSSMHGQNTLAKDPLVSDVCFNASMMSIHLQDGRVISVPLEWFPRLCDAGSDQLTNWQLSAAGRGIHWPDIDEDISVAGILKGNALPPVNTNA